MLGRVRCHLGRPKDESGQAMLVVLAAIALMATIPLVVVDTTVNQLPLTAKNLDWNAAYEAAQAGVNDYIEQIDSNSTYTEYNANNGTNNYGCSTSPINDAFCGWASSPTSTASIGNTTPPEWYQYSVTTNTGKVVLTVSGMAGPTKTSPLNAVRTFQYSIGAVATLDDIYWTTDESNVNFDTADVLYGPVFSNDDFNICGNPTFESTVQSADSGGVGKPYWSDTCGGSSPNFVDGLINNGGGPAPYEDIISNDTGPDVIPAETLGCYINGNVTFTLSGSSLSWSGGTVSNNSINTNNCNPSSTTFASLKSAVFYVNGNVTINSGGTVNGYLTIVAAGTTGSSTAGNITLDGSVTYPCADITYQSGGSCPSPPAAEGSDNSDALGLIAANNINISDNNAATTIDAAMIAINGSFQNSYSTNGCPGFGGSGTNPNNCPVLTVLGSIAQDTRGVVGHLSGSYPGQGYAKNYLYDNSLLVLWPPFFIPPAGATWTPRTYEECKSGASHDALSSSLGC